MKLIVDASVAVKWVISEEYNEYADILLCDRYELQAPEFICLECISVLWKKQRLNELSSEEAIEGFDVILSALKTLKMSKYDMKRTHGIAIELNHSVYDCLYLIAAIEQNSILITADRNFFNKVKSSQYSNHIHWISDDLSSAD